MSFPFPEDFVTQAPVISSKRLLEILDAVYGIKSAKCTKLTGYDDLNFLLEDVHYKDKVSAGRKFICKFSNPIEASLPDLMTEQIYMMNALNSIGIPVPGIVRTKKMENYEFVEMVDGVKLPIRLFEFMEGQTLESVGFDDETISIIGQLVAKFCNAAQFSQCLQDTKLFRQHRPLISLEYYKYLEREIDNLLEVGLLTEERAETCRGVFNELEDKIFRHYGDFEQGLIHSDINETNVLLTRGGDNKLQVSALLDFGDAHVSLRLFDYSSAILYIILGMPSENRVEDWKKVVRTFFKAFVKERKSAEYLNDIKHCQLAMRARLVASLIYGLRTLRINYRKEDPSYILKTQSNGWDVLKILTENDLGIPSLIQ